MGAVGVVGGGVGVRGVGGVGVGRGVGVRGVGVVARPY